MTLPTNKNSIIRKNNNHLNSPESLFEYVLGKTHLTTLTYPVLRENLPVNSNYVENIFNLYNIYNMFITDNIQLNTFKIQTKKPDLNRIKELMEPEGFIFV